MFQPGANTSAELFFEEREMFDPSEEVVAEESDENGAEDTDEDVDDLLDDDFEEKGTIKNLKKSIQTSGEDNRVDDA
jgi:hypothetical protein